MENNLYVARHELKFYINRLDYEYCKSLLKHLMKKDNYQKEDNGYFIRSLYFDDISDSAVQEKLDGIERRDKYRLRIYDTDQDWVKLERKRKVNNYVQKTSAIITREEALKMTKGDFDWMPEKNNQSLNSIYYDFKRKYLKPVVIVDYTRDAYMLDYNNIRITFDKALRNDTTDLTLFSPDVKTNPLQRDEVIIMEIKFNHCLPSWFQHLFKLESATASAISKYCQSRMEHGEYEFIIK